MSTPQVSLLQQAETERDYWKAVVQAVEDQLTYWEARRAFEPLGDETPQRQARTMRAVIRDIDIPLGVTR